MILEGEERPGRDRHRTARSETPQTPSAASPCSQPAAAAHLGCAPANLSHLLVKLGILLRVQGQERLRRACKDRHAEKAQAEELHAAIPEAPSPQLLQSGSGGGRRERRDARRGTGRGGARGGRDGASSGAPCWQSATWPRSHTCPLRKMADSNLFAPALAASQFQGAMRVVRVVGVV